MIRKHDSSGSALAHAEQVRREANVSLVAARRSALGQFMTPAPIAALMAEMFELRAANVRLLDAGAGVGSLSAAFVTEACRRLRRPKSIDVTAFELDPVMVSHLTAVLPGCEREAKAAGIRFGGHVVDRDFIETATAPTHSALFARDPQPRFNAAILNPPYRKIHSQSTEREQLRSAGIETSNLYTAFVALAIQLLEPGGELVAITPRSFCNGPYFRPFRQLLLRETALLRVHVFDARDVAFEDDEVLQENIIFHVKKGAPRRQVMLSASAGPHSEVRSAQVPHDAVVDPHDPNAFIHLAVSDGDREIAARVAMLPCTLDELGLNVSTGRVVDFRAREFLRNEPGARTVPLVYPAHFEAGFVSWPRTNGRKPNAIEDGPRTRALTIPNETYVLTKRFTSKEERRRIVAAIYDPARLPGEVERVGFENHLNYFHDRGAGLSKYLARGLATFLNTTLADRYFRQFNGHTQVNASDLRSLRYPSIAQLELLGRRVGRTFPDQERLDEIADGVLPSAPNASAR
jgi:adenine-specific DNA-methyltransferase